VSFDIETLKKKELLRIEEAAFWLDCSRATIYRLLEAGKLEGFRDGNRSRITRDSIERYIDSHLLDPSV
jgi:excisionase family DNA binding protein